MRLVAASPANAQAAGLCVTVNRNGEEKTLAEYQLPQGVQFQAGDVVAVQFTQKGRPR